MNCCKLQIVFKSQKKLANVFQFKDCLPFNLVSGVVYKYTCERCNSSYYDETDRHLKIRSEEYIGISPLTFRKVKPSIENAIHAHLLNCNNIPSFEEFTIFTKYILEIKETLLIMVIVIRVRTLFEIEVKNLIFIVKQFLEHDRALTRLPN